jgi:hypothetical protein
VRTFVGAKPVVVEFTAMLDTARPPQLRGQPQMQVVTEPPLSAPAVPAANGTSPVVPRRPRTAQTCVRTGARRAARARLRTATARPPRTARSRRRARARR